MKNILVTGHKGFIGSKLFARLKELDHIVFGIDRKLNGDILDYQDFPEVDVVFHLAGQIDVTSSMNDPIADAKDNILSTIKLAKFYQNARFVYVSSAATLNINSPYGLSKKTAAEYIKLLHKNYVVLILSNIFGLGGHSVLEKFLKEETIIIYGDGGQTRDFVHVDDIVEAMIKAMEWPKGEYDLGSDCSYQILELASLTGKLIKFENPRRGEIRDSELSNTSFGWKPKINPKEYLIKKGKI